MGHKTHKYERHEAARISGTVSNDINVQLQIWLKIADQWPKYT